MRRHWPSWVAYEANFSLRVVLMLLLPMCWCCLLLPMVTMLMLLQPMVTMVLLLLPIVTMLPLQGEGGGAEGV